MSSFFYASTLAQAQDQSASILLYHRFGENNYPSTNIRTEQFENHITILSDGTYSHVPLADIVQHLKAGTPLPVKTVSITVDDAYASVKTIAWPLLKEAGIPLTLFVSTDPVDQGLNGYLTWEEIRELKADGVTIGHHGAAHAHLPHIGAEATAEDIARASIRFEEELGEVPPLFAYPYGEYNPEIIEVINAAGFTAAFAQFSGAAALWSDTSYLPRFPVNERYGDAARFKLISQARALPVTDVAPLNPQLSPDQNPPAFGFTVDPGVRGLSALACYPSHLGRAADLVTLDGGRIEVRFDKPFPFGRSRINCTLPGPDRRWYWLGQFFLVPGGPLD